VSEPYIGEIRMFSFNFPPRGWAQCNGALLAIAQNQALFSLLGTTYGGNGQTTFALPDLQGRAPVHRANNGTYTQGEKSGVEAVTITSGTMATHTHILLATTTVGDKKVPQGALAASSTPANFYYSAPTNPVQINPGSIGSVGGSQAHPNMQPYLVINYCIALQGIFPSRN
jgi:microcystin-dependent protein